MSGSFPSRRQLRVYQHIRDSTGWIDTPMLVSALGETNGNIRHIVRYLADRGLVQEVRMSPAPKYRWLGPPDDLFEAKLEEAEAPEPEPPAKTPKDARMLDPRVREARAAGGRKGGKRRLETLTPERRSEIARMGGLATAENARRRREELEALRRGDPYEVGPDGGIWPRG